MSEEWCCEKLNQLKIKERRLTTLSEIRVQLNATESLKNITSRLINSPEIFECLEEARSNGESEKQFELASDILSICMANVSINDNNFNRTTLHRALEHEQPDIRALALNAILKELKRFDNPADFQLPDDTLMLILKCLNHKEISVGGPAISILSFVLINRIQSEAVRKILDNFLLNEDDSVKCRIYELAVNLAKHSAATLGKVEFLFDHAMQHLANDDILMQVNVMEVLVKLAERNHGLLFLERRKVFETIIKRIERLNENPIDRLLVPGIMKFFGKAAYVQPQKIIAGYPTMIHFLFDSIRSGDVTILPVAFDTFANLATTSQGKLILEANYGKNLLDIFQNYASYLRNLSSDLKNRAFNSLEIIFTTDTIHSIEVSEVLRKWFTYLAGSSNMQFLMDFCRNPFPDIKVPCLLFIKAVCKFKWGIEALKNTAGFIEYLLDRKIEFNKDAKFAKFELIQILAESNSFDVQTQLQLTAYVNQGPYYVQAVMEVAVEGDS